MKLTAKILLALGLIGCLATVQGFLNGTMDVPLEPQERQGYLAAVFGLPILLFIASAVLFVKAARRKSA